VIVINTGPIQRGIEFVSPHGFRSVGWPSWSNERREIVFQGAFGLEVTGIYVIGLSPQGSLSPPRRIVDGRLPSLSPAQHRGC
jgi:hypothetical protein